MPDAAGDRFLGAWDVTEHVFSPEGDHVGDVHQRRTLTQADDGIITVTQVCEPGSSLAFHPMGRFEGEWVFTLRVDGARRRYLGPDVVGTGTEWAPGAMTGEGIWPRFGCGFRSWSVLVRPDRQVTGGWFEVAGRPVAAIVGVGVPATGRRGDDPNAMPALDLTALAPAPPPDPGLDFVTHRFGPLLVIDGWRGPAHHVRRLVVADAVSGLVADLRVDDIDGVRAGVLVVDSLPSGP